MGIAWTPGERWYRPFTRPSMSPELVRFVRAAPIERAPIAGFVASFAASLRRGSRVLDAGAGSSPYREWFAHCAYVALDRREGSDRRLDLVCDVAETPCEEDEFDAVLLSEVLEHTVDPLAAIGELRRVLRPGGTLAVTVPFVWMLHEEPHDCHRFTEHGMRSLLSRAGFDRVDVTPCGGFHTSLGSLLFQTTIQPGQGERRRDLPLRALAGLVALTESEAGNRLLPTSYACLAS